MAVQLLVRERQGGVDLRRVDNKYGVSRLSHGWSELAAILGFPAENWPPRPAKLKIKIAL